MVRDEYLKGEAPYGYYVDKYKLYVSDDETPNVVKQIFKEYLKGSGVYSIAKRLTQYGISTPAMYKGKRNAGVNCMSVQCD